MVRGDTCGFTGVGMGGVDVMHILSMTRTCTHMQTQHTSITSLPVHSCFYTQLVPPLHSMPPRVRHPLTRPDSYPGPCGALCHLRVRCPLDPSIELAGLLPGACTVFKSALMPLKMVFRTEGAP